VGAISIELFGAVPDGKTKNTDAIAKAIDDVVKKGGGVVRVPAGDFLTGPVVLKSNVRLHLDPGSTLRFSTDPSDYPVVLTRWEGTECMNYSGLISARDAHDIAITGEGTIDGQGQTWWPWKSRAGDSIRKLRMLGETTDDPTQRIFGTVEAGLRPCLFEPINCQRINIEGVTFKSSPFWTIHPIYCSTIIARNLTIIGDGANTDGLDPDSCSNVLIEHCTFDTGDDCITLKSGRDRDGRRVGKPTENVTIRHCVFKNGHGAVTIGSEMSGGVRNVVAQDCLVDGPDTGIRIKSRIGRGGVVENVTCRRFDIRSVKIEAITINMNYEPGSVPKDPTPEMIPAYRNITIEDVTCASAKIAVRLMGVRQSPIENVTLKNVFITAQEGLDISHTQVKTENLTIRVR
jgi:polygalacturonase